MPLSCLLINIENKAGKVLPAIKRSRIFDVTDVYTDIGLLLGKILPEALNPDLIIIDYDTYKEYYPYLDPIRNKARLVLVICSNYESFENLVIRHHCQHVFCEKIDFARGILSAKQEIEEQFFQERDHGSYAFRDNCFKVCLNYFTDAEIQFKDLISIKRSSHFVFIGLKDKAYLSRFRLSNFYAFANKGNLLKVGKDLIINLSKINVLNIKTFQATMTNGDVVEIEKLFRAGFVAKLLQRSNLSNKHRELLSSYLDNQTPD